MAYGYGPEVITAPTIEPVALPDLKDHLRVTHSNDDSKITSYGKSARQYLEWRTGRTFFKTTWEYVRDRFPLCGYIQLPQAAPLLSVSSIKYTDSDGNTATWDPSLYSVNADAKPAIITPAYGQTWPVYTPSPTGSVRIRYIAGLDDAASPLVYPPDELLSAIKLLTEDLYSHTGNLIADERGLTNAIRNPSGTEALIAPYIVTYGF